MRDALKEGSTTAAGLLAEARRVIKEKDGDINAFIEVFDSADADAERADAMIQKGEGKPLTGIPIAVKDNICISGNTVTAGSKMLEGFVAPYDAAVIASLREQGAVIVGRTNMDEFAMGSSTEYSVYGTTHNPHDTSRVAGGSSGGSAAAVAMGAVPLALGSDTGGSVRQPASFCGVIGLKPTYGNLSRHGLIALGSSLDVIGLFARSADDVAECYSALSATEDEYDNTYHCYADITHSAPEKTIGIPDNLSAIGISQETMDAFNTTIVHLEGCGYTTRPISLPIMEKAGAIYYIIQPAEASSNLARFDGVRYGFHKDGGDVFGDYVQTRTAGFGDEVMRRIVVGTYVLSAGYYDAYYRKAASVRNAMRLAFSNVLQEVSLIAIPTTPDVAFKEGSVQDPVAMYAEDRLTLQANLTGLPAISAPTKADGLPRGIQLIGGYNNEEVLFSCVRDIEAQHS